MYQFIKTPEFHKNDYIFENFEGEYISTPEADWGSVIYACTLGFVAGIVGISTILWVFFN